jgi:hypothetical protein
MPLCPVACYRTLFAPYLLVNIYVQTSDFPRLRYENNPPNYGSISAISLAAAVPHEVLIYVFGDYADLYNKHIEKCGRCALD